MYELYFHARKKNLELSRREFIAGGCSVLEHHPFSVGLGVFDTGFDNGCGLFHRVSWAGSPRALPFPALLYSSSSEYLVPKCQLPVFTSYCYP